MLSVDFNGRVFVVTAPVTHVGVCKAIPSRRFDKNTRAWLCPPTRSNIDFFQRFRAVFTDEARDFINGRTEAAVSRGKIPAAYSFKLDPLAHQLEALQRSIPQDVYALLMDPGTGKSKVIIDDASCYFLSAACDTAVVVCPNSIKSNWKEEIEKHSSIGHDIFVYDPSVKKQFLDWMTTPFDNGLKWAIVSVESFSQGDAVKYVEKLALLRRAVLYIDESSRIKTHDSNRTKAITKIGTLFKRRRIATGTAVTKGPQDLYAQYNFLDPDIIGGSSFYSFRNRYCVMGGYKQKQIVGTQNEDELLQLIGPYTYRIAKSECLNLPPKVYQIRRVEPSAEQKAAYKALKSEGYAEKGNLVASFTNALVRDLRLQQISSGFFPGSKLVDGMVEEGGVTLEPFKGKNPKIEELLQVVEEVDGKIIVWCRFQREVQQVSQALSKVGGVVTFYGLNTTEDNTLARQRFMNDPDVRFFVGTQSAGGIGITLVSASTVIYMSNTFMLDDRIQSEDRAHRIGQTSDSVLYIDILIDDNWVDSRVLEALKSNRNYADWLMDEIRRIAA
jgi:SNF2 family DNA or RNA helicase